jgi:protein gp37
MSFKNLKVLTKKPTKSIKIMPHLKLFKNMLLGKKIEKQTKIATHMDV